MIGWSSTSRFLLKGLLLFILFTACNGSKVATDPAFPQLHLQTVVKGLTAPLGLTNAGDKSNRLFVVEQGGTIQILKNGALLKKPFLDIRNKVISGGELGLLGLAFHPKFSENRRFFLNYTAPSGPTGIQTVISEFKVTDDPESANPASERILLTIPQPFKNHNGGQLAFGPDGYLYIGMGDGGSANDPLGNGQNLATLLGKMLRINVDAAEGEKGYAVPPDNPFVGTKGAAPEVWAYGLRNPWRFSFDSDSGFLFAGDVGQLDREEIDHIQKGKNYGWNIMEGTICTPGVNPNCNKNGLELPLVDLTRRMATTVIGGYVYRGSAIPKLAGFYLYADFGNGKVSGFRYDGKAVSDHRLLFETGRNISSLGQDEQRELYLVVYTGEILKIIP